jgi:hypothetical protein
VVGLACELLGELGAATATMPAGDVRAGRRDDGNGGVALCLGPPGTPRATLTPLPPDLRSYAGAGTPEGTVDLATARALAAGALAARMAGRPVEVDGLSVAVQLQLPAVMAASYGSDWWPVPPAPRSAAGGGWYNAELGGPENAAAFERLIGTLGPDVDAATVAAAAQEWRLPVCEYRPPTSAPPWRDSRGGRPADPGPAAADPRMASLDGLRVLDLTSMWAGPLATWLLARLGADVIKVEPTVRPDGFRALGGRGVWPAGRARRADGSESGVFNALNSAKRSVAIDAREDGESLRELASSADLVVDSFSPRVMDQLGLSGPALRLSMPAFPPGPLRQWVAYGTGVHALSGLGFQGADSADVPYRQPGVTYPDPLSGLLAVVVGLAALDARQRGSACHRYEVSLAASVEALSRAPRRLLPTAPGVGRTLLAAAIEAGAVVTVDDGAGVHWYPVGPWRGVGDASLSGAPPHPDPRRRGEPIWKR